MDAPLRCVAAALLLSIGLAACSDRSPEEVAPAPELAGPAPEPEPPPPPEVAPDAEAEIVAHGIAKVERVFVRHDPADDSRAVGVLRWGQRFEVSETREVDGATWHRMRGVGWIKGGDEVNIRTAGPAGLGFIPVAPRMDHPLPYRYTLVTADEVPVYRRPPRRGEDPERARIRNLQKGYYFTIDKFVNIYDRQMYRTTRYWFIPRDGTTPVVGPEFEGIEVDAQTELPFLWITDPTARLCDAPLTPGSDERPSCEPVERHTRVPLRGRREAGGVWYQTDDDKWIASLQVARVDRVRARPEGVRDNQKWIHVDLRNQFAALYVGDHMQFVTLISSGDDDHPTPTGTFTIESKHVTATMDDENNLSGPYFIQDVPWVLYFRGGYALHGAFWHDRFGLKTSHGCVNLSPTDARRFFEFADRPELPEGLHAVYVPPDRQGTVVHITD